MSWCALIMDMVMIVWNFRYTFSTRLPLQLFYVMIVLNGANTASTIPTLSTLPTAQDKVSSVH